MVRHNDPVYGLIQFHDDEEEITRTREWQFQREHHQLGLTDLVYLMAELSRRPHLYGAGMGARMMATQLRVPPKDVTLITQGGLTHDLGHYDFSHVLEHIAEDLLQQPDHEKNGINLILGNTQLPGKHWLPPINEVLRRQESRGGTSPERLAALLYGGDAAKEAGLPPYYHEIISNPVCDCDRMDYLMRDGIITGVKRGSAIEFNRIVEHLLIAPGDHLGIDERGLEAARQVIETRRAMYEVVYFHGITQKAETMLRKAVELSLDEAKPLMWGDHRLLDRLLERGCPKTEELILRIKSGYKELYPTVLEVDPRPEDDSTLAQKVRRLDMKSRTIEADLLQRAGLQQGDIIVSYAKYKNKGKQHFPVKMRSGNWRNIFEIPAVAAAYGEPSALTRFCVYAHPDHVDKATSVAHDFLAERP